jgi:hypothetical protein
MLRRNAGLSGSSSTTRLSACVEKTSIGRLVLDHVTGTRRLSPFVAHNVEGQVVDEVGFETAAFKHVEKKCRVERQFFDDAIERLCRKDVHWKTCPRYATRRLSPFVAHNVEGQVVDEVGFETAAFKPAYIKEEMPG